jgi:hypothetical protein
MRGSGWSSRSRSPFRSVCDALPRLSGHRRECLKKSGFGGWPDTPGGAWRGGLIMSGTMDPMATDVDQQELDDPSMVASQAMSVWSWRKICLAMKRLRQRRISRGLFPSAVRRPM